MSDFFGMLSKSLKPLMDLTGQKPDENTIPLFLKGEVDDLLASKTKALASIGEAMIAMVGRGNLDAGVLAVLKPLCATVEEIDLKLKAKVAELEKAEADALAARKKKEAADAARTCPQCGTMNAEGISFCQECGARLGQPKPGKCPSCGMDNPPGTRFCGECGTKIPAANVAAACSACGASNPPGTRFCSECGAKIAG